jgi:hypothetical protein
MKTVSLSELKKELYNLPEKEVLDICLRLAKYKKENKELLNYLLFEANDEESYIIVVKKEIDKQYTEINSSNIYFAKKSLRKILRFTNKQIKYSGLKQTEVELLIYYCKKLRKSGIDVSKSTALTNIYTRQIQKIKKSLSTLHEDLQHDYKDELQIIS